MSYDAAGMSPMSPDPYHAYSVMSRNFIYNTATATAHFSWLPAVYIGITYTAFDFCSRGNPNRTVSIPYRDKVLG